MTKKKELKIAKAEGAKVNPVNGFTFANEVSELAKYYDFKQDVDLDAGAKIAQIQGLQALGAFGHDHIDKFPEPIILLDRLRWFKNEPEEYKKQVTARIAEILKTTK